MNIPDDVRSAFSSEPPDTFAGRLWTILFRAASPQVLSVRIEWGWPAQEQGFASIDSVRAEFADGSAGSLAELDSVSADFRDDSATTSEAELDSVDAEWGMVPGSYDVAQAELDSVEAGFRDDSTPTASAELYNAAVEWSWAIAAPGETDKVLFVQQVDGAPCSAVRVSSSAPKVEQDLVRVLVRVDRTGLAKSAWASYQEGVLDQTIELTQAGNVVEVALIGPDTLPDDTDFTITFVRE